MQEILEGRLFIMYSQPSILKITTWLCVASYLQYLPMAQETVSPGLRRRLIQSEGCILSKVETDFDDGKSTDRWECELQPDDADEAGVLFVNLEGLDDTELDMEAVSGQTSFFAEGAVIADGRLSVPKGSKKNLAKIDKRGPAETSKKSKKGSKKGGRKLVPLGPVVREVLVVRVNALDASTTADMATLAGDVFGIGRETTYVSLSERLNACSYGETQVTPYNGVTPNGVTILNGVTEIGINVTVNGTLANSVHNTVLRDLRVALGIPNLASVFDHVMLCLPPGTLGTWIAYAYVNNWLSVYNNDWCRYPSSQAHEVGHNLGLNHASEGTVVYGDRIGFMGFSYNMFDQRMCYSPAKSWQLGWYSLKQETLDFNSRGGFTGSLVGISDYQNSQAAGKYVHLRIVGAVEDLYIGYNHNTGINANTREAMNQVTVQAQTGPGVSSLRAKLNMGNQYIAPQFLNGKDLIIIVHTIKRGGNPAYADVSVYLDGCPPGQCGIDCHVPCPTSAPTTTITLPNPLAGPGIIPPTPVPTTLALPMPVVSTSGVGSASVAPLPTPAPLPMPAPLPTPVPLPTLLPTPLPTAVVPLPPATNMFIETFESGVSSVFQVSDGAISTKFVNTVTGSTKSLRLNSYGSRLDTLTAYSIGTYRQINIKLWYLPTRGVSGDKILVDLSVDDGISWITIAKIGRNREFRVDKIWYEKLIAWPVSAGVQSIRVRISTTTSNNNSRGKIFLDDISMEGM